MAAGRMTGCVAACERLEDATMCGTSSAVGLGEQDRTLWPLLRERLRRSGQLMGLMRGVLGGDTAVAAVVTTTPRGIVRPIAIIVTSSIADEITLLDAAVETDVRRALIGDDEVEVLIGPGTDDVQPVAIFVTDWIREHLNLYARELWHRAR
jgi:hypothetical protein